MSSITFQKGNGGLARTRSGEDFYSGLLVLQASIPSVFANGATREYGNLAQAEADGIALGSSTTGRLHYYIKRFFDRCPGGLLTVGVRSNGDVADATLKSHLKAFVLGANRKLRQVAMYVPKDLYTVSGGNTTINALASLQAGAEELEADEAAPVQVLYACDFSDATDHTSFPALTAFPLVAVCIGASEQGQGTGLAVANNRADLGACLGDVAAAKVHENIGWVEKFNIEQGQEMASPVLDGCLQKVSVLTEAQKEALANKGYVFAHKEVGIGGTYWYDDRTAVVPENDYAQISANRTMHKAMRGIRTALLPKVRGPIYVQANGNLRPEDAALFQTIAAAPLGNMVAAGELSGDEAAPQATATRMVSISPAQNILSTRNLQVDVSLLPVGVTKAFTVPIKFVTSLA